MKANDLRAALWAGVIGSLLGVYAQFFEIALQTPSSIGNDPGIYAEIARDQLSIRAGVLCFFMALLFRLYRSRKGSHSDAKARPPLHRKIACVMILSYLVPLMSLGWIQRHQSGHDLAVMYYFVSAGLVSYIGVLILAVSLIWQGLSCATSSIKSWAKRQSTS